MPEDNKNVVRPNEGYGAGCVLLFIAWNGVGLALALGYGKEWWRTAVLLLVILHVVYWIGTKVSGHQQSAAADPDDTPPDPTPPADE